MALAAFALIADAAAQTVYYRWVDKDGKTQFSDKPPPATFKGEVIKVPLDALADPVPRAMPPATAPAKARAAEVEEKAPDLNTRRRQQREALEARVLQARANLEAAKKALEEGDSASDEEKQYVRQNFPRNEKQPQRTPPPRSNCMSDKTSDGKTIWNCPRPIPTLAYYERQQRLEEAVRKAEEELSEAERDYRRNVD
jgi:hypothetical protein